MDISKQMKEMKFCYAKEDGQGYVHKSRCTCTKECPCQATIDKSRFHDALKDIDIGDIESRNKIIQEIKPEFKNSQWWRDNVIE